jgi:CubicO group peptidase (beta-lactamase class C family)
MPRFLRIPTVVVVLAALMTGTAVAQPIPSVAPEALGLSPDRLARIDRHIQGYVDRKEAAGALGLIARNGKIGYMKTWGDLDREAGKKLQEDTIFRIYSMSKPITSVAVMMLHEEGHFFLDDPVARFLPELAMMKVQTETIDPKTKQVSVETKPATRPITIRDLLRHTAGLSYGVFGNTKVDQAYREAGILSDRDLKEMVGKLGKIPLRFEPGTHWHYSVSVDVAGRLVEVVSGMSFDQFLQKRLFEPLEMKDTGFSVPASKADRFSVLYTPKGQPTGRDAFLQPPPETKRIEPLVSNELAGFGEDTTFFSGGGGMVSTARDYLRFCQMMLNGGQLNGKRILSRKAVELMTADHLHNITGYRSSQTFGLGFAVLEELGRGGKLGSVGTFDWGGAAGTKFWIDPREELIGIFMVQILPHRTRMGDEFRLLTYQAIDD